MGQRPKQTFLQRRHTDGQQAHEKMLNITNLIREMQIKITIRYHLTLVRMAIILKSKQIINAGEGAQKGEPSYTVGENVNWYSHYEGQCGDCLKN